MKMKFDFYIFKPIKENGLFGFSISLRRIMRKIYNIIFLYKSNIIADYTSYIYGLHFMQIGSLYVGRNCRIEMITEYNGKKLHPLLKIGKNVGLNDMVHIGCANYIEIGDNCLFASRIYVSDHNHGLYKGFMQSKPFEIVGERVLDSDKKVIIGKNVWIGEGVSVLPGTVIGDNSIIGANSVVCGEIPANSIAVGSPAKVVKQYNFTNMIWKKNGYTIG